MKSKKEILADINNLEYLVNTCGSLRLRVESRAKIEALKWVLEDS